LLVLNTTKQRFANLLRFRYNEDYKAKISVSEDTSLAFFDMTMRSDRFDSVF